MNRDLRPAGPIETIDRALLLVRRGGWRVAATGWLAGLLPLGALLGAYYLERVEGVRSMRLALALGLVLAWLGRSLLLSAQARDFTRALWENAPIPENAGRTVDVVRTAAVVGLGLWIWLWVLVGATLLGPLGVLLLLPVLGARGMIAPSWLARARCTTDGGFR